MERSRHSKLRPHKVVLCPAVVESIIDGDLHFIGVAALRHLYNVRDIDIVRVYDPKFIEQWRREGFIELAPRYRGDYYDIHKDDEFLDVKPRNI